VKYQSRKFRLACFFAIAGSILAACELLTADYVGLAALIMGTYGYANVKAKAIDPTD